MGTKGQYLQFVYGSLVVVQQANNGLATGHFYMYRQAYAPAPARPLFLPQQHAGNRPTTHRAAYVQGHKQYTACRSGPAGLYAAVLPYTYQCLQHFAVFVTAKMTTAYGQALS
jgi:hypothetical protein